MTRRKTIDKFAALRIATRTILEHHRGPCTVQDVHFDAQRRSWSVSFRPQPPGIRDTDVIDGGPLVVIDAETGLARLIDMTSTGPTG